MVGSGSTAAFRQKLGELNTKSSSKIRELTEMAIRFQNEALDIALTWDAEVKQAAIIRYQPLFSLADSILKKASAAYKNAFGQILLERYPACILRLKNEKDEQNLEFFHKMLTVSWIKHSLLPPDVLTEIERKLEEFRGAVQQQNAAQQQYNNQASSNQGAVSAPGTLSGAGASTARTGGAGVSSSSAHTYDEAKRKRIIQIMHNLVTGQIGPGDREEIITIPEICEAIRLQKEGKKAEAQKQLARFKQILEPEEGGIAGAQPGSRMPDPFPGGKRAPSPQGVDAAAKRAKVENRIFNMDWCGRFLERLQGHKKVFIQQSVGRQILGSTQDQYLGVDELHPNEVQLILQFIFQVEEHIRASEEAAMESSAIPLHFNTVRHLRAERLLEKYFDDFPYQCMTCGRRFNTRALLAMHHDTHYKNNMRRRKILNKEIVEEKTYRGWECTIQDWMGIRDLKLASVWENKQKDGEENRGDQEEEADEEANENAEKENVAPYSEGQPCCPTCGELFNKAFINGDWWVTGVSVFDAITSQPLTYDTSQSGRRLHENAIIYHKGCLPSYLVQED